MPTLTAEATMLRLAAVERKVQVKGWSAEVIAELCDELGVTRSTVYDDWNRIKGMTRRFVTRDLEKQRREQMAVLDTLIIRAMNAGDYAAAASAMKVKGQISGTIAPPGTKVEVNVSQHNSAIIAQVSALSVDEQEQRVRQLVDQHRGLTQVVEADAVPVPSETPADLPPR